MGLFKSIKKAFKKVTGFVKKNIKKVVSFTKKQFKNVSKVVKKIKKSKLLKALVIAAAIVVTGGAALTAFGGTGALATSQLGTFMMNTSAKALGGTLFTGATTTLGQAAQATGNFLVKTAAKPFGAVGSTLGSTARVGKNILTGKPAFQAGQGKISATGSPLVSTGAGNVPTGGQAAAAPFSGTAYAGNQPTPTTTIDGSGEDKPTMASRARDFAGKVGTNVVSSLAVGYATESAFGDGSTGGYGSNLRTEGASSNENLRIYAVERGIDVGSIYNNMTYGTAEPSFAAGSSLYNQATVGVPE
tara:strand:+ start:63 stop:968 length:906 start_codon:yes stop_codon:yes gene_type:complete